jgi:hypothetical protein
MLHHHHHHQGNPKKIFNIFGKFGVPNPVTGSHPLTASKPGVPHPWLPPCVISLNIPGFAYSVGLINPIGPFPTSYLAALQRQNTTPDRRATTRAINIAEITVDSNDVVDAVGRYVREATGLLGGVVPVWTIGRFVLGEVGLYGGCLVGGEREDV